MPADHWRTKRISDGHYVRCSYCERRAVAINEEPGTGAVCEYHELPAATAGFGPKRPGAYPLTASGKVQKTKLREHALKEFNLGGVK